MTKTVKIKIAVLVMWLVATTAFGARVKTAWQTYVQPDGSVLTLTLSGDEHFSCFRDLEGRMYSRDSLGTFHLLDAELIRRQMTLTRSEMPDLSYKLIQWDPNRTYRQLVVLVSFADCDFSQEDPQATYDAMFNQRGYNQMDGPGCVADYFRDQSNGLFNMQFDVYGPFKVNSKAQSSGKDSGQASFRQAIQQLMTSHPDIDYTPYDWDGDGTVDQVVYVYAGYNGNQAGYTDYIWPNTSWLSRVVNTPDGHEISDYTASGELGSNNQSCGIGTICHEFSHCLGLPDIYPTFGALDVISIVDEWDLMDGGNYTNWGWCPPNYSSLEKMLMGWLTPKELTKDTVIYGMQSVADGGEVYIIRHTDDEFYLLENRQWRGWDAGLPGHGLVVFHVKYDPYRWNANIVNTVEDEPYYSLVAADNLDYSYWYDLFKTLAKSPYANAQRMNSTILSTAPYPCLLDSAGNMNRELSATSVPSALMYNAGDNGERMLSKSITDITQNEDGTVSFSFHASTPDGMMTPSTTAANPSTIYNLTGSKVQCDTISRLPKGFYIIDGKKIIIR